MTTLAEVAGDGESREVDLNDFSLNQYAGERIAFKVTAINESVVTVNQLQLTYDTDGDGLSDAVERGGIRTGSGRTIHTSPALADTDNDGLSDGEEVGRRAQNSEGNYFILNSNPERRDTDGDRLSDGSERVWNTDPLNGDSDGDGFDDMVDPDPLEDSRIPMVTVYSGSPVSQRDGDLNEHATFRVSDTSGIDAATLTAVYDPLYGERKYDSSGT